MTIFRKNKLTMGGSPTCSTMSNRKSSFKSVDKQVKFKLSPSKKNKDDTIIVTVAANDTNIQSTDKKRRYMRRGSRAPSMMTVSQNEIDQLVEIDEQQQQVLSFEETNNEMLCPDHNQQLIQFQSQSQQRRMSVMTSLKSNFERVTIIESTAKQIRRRMSLVEAPGSARRFSLELVRIRD